MNIIRPSDTVKGTVNVAVMGLAGVGKTSLLRTVPDLSRTLVLSAEAGLLSVADLDVAVAEIRTVDNMREAVAFLRGADGSDRFDLVFVDSLSEIGEICLSEMKRAHKDGRAAYGETSETMTKIIKALRDLPKTVVLTSKAERSETEDGALVYTPALPGRKLAQSLPYLLDEVFAMHSAPDDSGEIQRWFQTRRDRNWDAKDRSGKLEAVEPANIAHILGKIAGN